MNSESLETVRNPILAGLCIVNGRNCRELEECGALCGCGRTTQYGYRRLIARNGGGFQAQTQNHRALTALNPTTFSNEEGLVANQFTVLLTLGLTGYCGTNSESPRCVEDKMPNNRSAVDVENTCQSRKRASTTE